ncbi:MAG TPA: hypothetical protein VMV86_07040 [Methanosarcinales archaeon]|nr:hypothetical protein [Methanosarcinales archaeon]
MAVQRLGFVEGADYSKGLAGIGAIGKDMREGAKQKQSGELMKKALAGDTEAYGQLAALNPEMAAQAKNTMDVNSTLEKGNMQKMFAGAKTALGITDPDPMKQYEKRKEFLKRRVEQGEKEGRNMSHTKEALSMGTPEELEQTLNNTINLATNLGVLGGDPEEFYKMVMEENFKNDLKLGSDWQKGQWQDAKAAQSWFDKRANELYGSYNKILGLSDAMGKDQKMARTAINGAIMSLARMISPGVVTETDAKQMAGATDPVTYATSMLFQMAEKDPSKASEFQNAASALEGLRRSFDPSDPNTFDVPAFLNIARKVAGAEIPGLKRFYAGAKAKAERSGMKEEYLNTYFGDNEMMKLLDSIENPGANPVATNPTANGGATTAAQDLESLTPPNGR